MHVRVIFDLNEQEVAFAIAAIDLAIRQVGNPSEPTIFRWPVEQTLRSIRVKLSSPQAAKITQSERFKLPGSEASKYDVSALKEENPVPAETKIDPPIVRRQKSQSRSETAKRIWAERRAKQAAEGGYEGEHDPGDISKFKPYKDRLARKDAPWRCGYSPDFALMIIDRLSRGAAAVDCATRYGTSLTLIQNIAAVYRAEIEELAAAKDKDSKMKVVARLGDEFNRRVLLAREAKDMKERPHAAVRQSTAKPPLHLSEDSIPAIEAMFDKRKAAGE